MRTPEQEDSYELHVLRDAMDETHGHFVNLVIEATQVADSDNFESMRPILRKFIRKISLKCGEKCQRDGTGWKDPVPEWATRETSDSRTGRLSMPKDGLVWIGDSLLDSFLAPYKDKEVTIEVREL